MKLLNRGVVLVAGLMVTLVACGGTGPTMPGPPELPVTPPDPGPAPSLITDVADILSGAATGEVLVAGELSRVANASRDEWWLSDGTGEVVLDFSSDHLPPTGTLILVWGTVDTGPEIDVIEWAEIAMIPMPPVTPPVTPPDPTAPPSLVVTSVSEVLSGSASGEVILAGSTTRQQGSDDDEWWFTDGTGEVVLDFPSNHIAPVNTPIWVWGKVSSSEIDVIEWMLQ